MQLLEVVGSGGRGGASTKTSVPDDRGADQATVCLKYPAKSRNYLKKKSWSLFPN